MGRVEIVRPGASYAVVFLTLAVKRAPKGPLCGYRSVAYAAARSRSIRDVRGASAHAARASSPNRAQSS